MIVLDKKCGFEVPFMVRPADILQIRQLHGEDGMEICVELTNDRQHRTVVLDPEAASAYFKEIGLRLGM